MRRPLALALLIVVLFLGQSADRSSHSNDGQRRSARGANDTASQIGLSSSADYNGTDWNNDGDIGSSSDQFIELWNSGAEPVDVSDWLLDDIAEGGSGPCRLA